MSPRYRKITDGFFDAKFRSRFWSKVDKSGGCWAWTAYTDMFGYGVVALGYTMARAHRISYEMEKGTIPEGLQVRHLCHNPSCVRPDHLEIGTQKDNMRDMIEAGRCLRGEERPNAKLKSGQVRDIRRRHKEGVTQVYLAKEYGVTSPNISAIIRRQTWAHIA